MAALQEVIRENRGKRVAVGIHGTIMTLIMRELDGRFDYEFSRNLSTPDVYLLTFHNGLFAHAQRIWS
jgi:2,3-bisphosphoglycerate-dependent phosphoglycerate mutase